MILRRVIDHFRKQEWTAIAILRALARRIIWDDWLRGETPQTKNRLFFREGE